jgi:hypothetical protein
VGIRPLPAGTVAAGPPLLIFNGIGANLELAGPMVARLGAIETLIFDVPGAGKSPPPKFPYRLFMLARLARKLLDELGWAGRRDGRVLGWRAGAAVRHPVSEARAPPGAGGHRNGPAGDVAGPSARAAEDAQPAALPRQGIHEARGARALRRRPAHPPEAIKLFTDHARAGHPTGYRYQMLAMLGWTSLPWLWRIRHPTL